ncbi:lipoprotein [Spiroplasma endosymbiont of Othius punctulatus]|uniref:lipoprotein n=1 Tax=Spiroplasma endosymbiont of Othius punctulatus TaxID=3066289 RepID=UPI0030CBC074
MRKLLALIGAITLTTTIGAVTVVSCGMKTLPIDLFIGDENIGDKETGKKYWGEPQKTMISLLEFLTFNEAKYNHNDAKLKKVYETFGEEVKTQNLYEISKTQDEDLYGRLTSKNNDGFKEIKMTNEFKELDAKTKMRFTLITEVSKDGNLQEPSLTPTKTYENYKAAFDDESIWNHDNKDKPEEEFKSKNREKFEEAIKTLEEKKVIGDSLPYSKDTTIKIIDKPTEGENTSVFNTEPTLTYIKSTEENKDSKYGVSLMDSFVVGEIPGGSLNFEIKYGDLNNLENDETIKIKAAGIKTVWMPSTATTKETTEEIEVDGKKIKQTTRTSLYYWVPYLFGGFTFANNPKDFSGSKNMFDDIKITLETETTN